ncbi:MAG TPA: sulfite reductase subunit A [Chromatiales bacterium]|nr:sulfite reductase subunit A [Chromatiales bacterium]
MAIRAEPGQLARLFDAIQADGYALVGPTFRDGAVVLDRLAGVGDLPRGVVDEQKKGHYRAVRTGSRLLFGFHAPAQTFRRFLQPPGQTIFRATRNSDGSMNMCPDPGALPRLALIGVKACDLAAITVQDVVSGYRPNPARTLQPAVPADPHYRAIREHLLVVATECGSAGKTCFCASMQTGPGIEQNFDLRITEFDDGEHWLLIDAGTGRGHRLLQQLDGRAATQADHDARRRLLESTRSSMGRQLDTDGLAEALAQRLDSPRWQAIGERCLSCANCTLSCPTCFCTDVADSTDITGQEAVRTQTWDSCFNRNFSRLHGGHIRKTTASRYRQWLTHKLSTWHGQFGSSGCTGCGRCITWCPVGIDITEEAVAIVHGDGAAL